MNSDNIIVESFFLVLLIISIKLVSQAFSPLSEISIFFLTLPLLFMLIVFYLYYYLNNSHDLIRFEELSKSDLIYFVSFLLIILIIIYPLENSNSITYLQVYDLVSLKGLLAITLIVIIEEIVFRGMIYENLKSISNKKYATVASSLLFALSHFYLLHSFSSTLLIFILGVIFCLSYEGTENLGTSISVHLFYNYMVIITLLI